MKVELHDKKPASEHATTAGNYSDGVFTKWVDVYVACPEDLRVAVEQICREYIEKHREQEAGNEFSLCGDEWSLT